MLQAAADQIRKRAAGEEAKTMRSVALRKQMDSAFKVGRHMISFTFSIHLLISPSHFTKFPEPQGAHMVSINVCSQMLLLQE